MEGLSTMEMVGGKMGKDMVADRMTGVDVVVLVVVPRESIHFRVF